MDSMNYFLTDGMQAVVADMKPLEIQHPGTKQIYKFWFSDPHVAAPMKEDALPSTDNRLFPWECREAGLTYKGAFTITINWAREDGSAEGSFVKKLGGMPIMTKSRACHLSGLSRTGLVALKEEANEMGGYFICNGLERIIRCIIAQRRHYIMGLRRGAYQKRGANYTDCATLIRCVRPDQSSATVRCHYLTDGTVNFAFTMRRAEYFIPAGILLKCFLEVSDRELYDKLLASAPPGSGHAAFVAERAELLLQQSAKLGLYTRAQCLDYLGRHFRTMLNMPKSSSVEVAHHLLGEFVFIHLDQKRPADKLALLMQMLHKLYALANSVCCEDNADALTHHELLLPGHLLCKFLKEKLYDSLELMLALMRKDLGVRPPGQAAGQAPEEENTASAGINLESERYLRKVADKLPDIGRKFEYLLNTGNLVSKNTGDLTQTSGFTIVAEKLNWFRYISHFRSVHRGAYFAQLRTTAVRKLLPESWGFMCPVHTPDGAPCGLLNHFTAACRVVTQGPEHPQATEAALLQVLSGLGMVPSAPATVPPGPPSHLTVFLDGKVVGTIPSCLAAGAVTRLREIKACLLELTGSLQPAGSAPSAEQGAELDEHELMVPQHTEVVHIPFAHNGVFPGLFLFTQSARMVRPVKQLGSKKLELIGTLEQNNMSIRCPDTGAGGSAALKFTHEELNTGSMLSVVASLTPYSDYNQSPRNMYQCQMAKQTMGTPCQALQHRTDNKLYRLQTPQTPLARTSKYDEFCMDEYPAGTNAVVAVLSYTGYDMEDAMILNKSSVERGLAHASVYKTETVDLREERGARMSLAPEPHDARSKSQPYQRPVGAFGQTLPQNVPCEPNGSAATGPMRVMPSTAAHKDSLHIGPDGLPHAGAIIWPGQTVYCARDETTGRYKAHKLKGEEVATVDQVTLIGTKEKNAPPQRANIRLRFNRNPQIGDKFASRAGQKGVLSILWPDVDMPYCCKTGMRPDLIINPHAFPSRMTIGMLIESLASKAGALTGNWVDATPFQASDGKPGNPAEHYGRMLEANGYAKHGQETMISGLTGEEMQCDIYIGLVYYQRLRHMVSDKFQVRSTGAVNNLTKQPIKGRKFGGGIRFGEMERDSLLAHGAAYLLHDRLHACSDYSVMDVCGKCGSLVAPLNKPHAAADALAAGLGPTAAAAMTAMSSDGGGMAGRVVCPVCDNSSRHISRVAMPYVFKYLATELAAMNIKLSIDTV